MEEKILKLMAQLGFVAVVIWILAGLLGKRDQVSHKDKRNGRIMSHQKQNSFVNYATPVVTAPMAEGSTFYPPPIMPITRY